MEDRAHLGTAFRSVRSRPGPAVVIVGLCTFMVGVAGCSRGNKCIPGVSVECSCANGRRSAQVCAAEARSSRANAGTCDSAPSETCTRRRRRLPGRPGAHPGGTFWMGDQDLDKSKPVHKVTLSPYCIDKTEVTVAPIASACKQALARRPARPSTGRASSPRQDKMSQFCNLGQARV